MQLKSNTKRFASALAAVLALAACGNDDEGPSNNADGGLADQGVITADGATNVDGATETDGSTTPDMAATNEIAFDDLPAAVADAWCSRTECFSELGDDFFATIILGASTDPAVCRSRLTRVLSTMLSVEAEGYDPAAAFDCVQTIRNPATECADVMEPKCPALEAGNSDFHGNVATGGECLSSDECEAGLRCDRADLPDYRCAGTCQPGGALGDACDGYDDCANLDDADVTCDLSTGNGHTALNICVRTAYENTRAEGESCTEVTFDEATNTLTSNYCARGLNCSDGVCEKTEAALGEDCTELECADGLTCPESGEDAGTCQPFFSFVFTDGAPCGLTSEESLVFCDFLSGPTGYVCDITNETTYTGTCRPIGDGSLGSVCLAFDELGFKCADGLFCATEYREGIFAGRCSEPLADNESCSDDNNCLSGICEYSSQLSRSICLEANLENGAGCSNNEQCESGNCAFDGEGYVCAALECTPDL